MHTTKLNVTPNTGYQKLFWGLSKSVFLKTLLLPIVGISVLALTSCLDPNANGDLDNGTNGNLYSNTNGDLDGDTNGDLDGDLDDDGDGELDDDGDGELKIDGIITTPVEGNATLADNTLTILPAVILAKNTPTTWVSEGNASMVKVMDVFVNYSGVNNIKGMLFVKSASNSLGEWTHARSQGTSGGSQNFSEFYPDAGDFSMTSRVSRHDNGLQLLCIGKMADVTIECYLVRSTTSDLDTGATLAIKPFTFKLAFIGGRPADFDVAFNVATEKGTKSIDNAALSKFVVADGISTAELPITVDGTVTTGE